MITENIIKFGSGDIGVGLGCQIITFQQIKPPKQCGERFAFEDVEFVSHKISIEISDICEYAYLHSLLQQINDKEINSFEFKGYIFDFTEFNEQSVNVVKSKLDACMRLYMLALAC